jgi:regulator of replication initiation timing
MTPEEIELDKKRRVLDRLKDRLADREEELAELRAELDLFEGRYKIEVARYYADLDEIEAEIAEEELKLVPDDEEIKKKVEELRRRAAESAAEAETDASGETDFKPTAEAKKAYHNLARIIHPDLALDADEKERRHVLMAQLNEAYSIGDQTRLNKLAEDFRDSPDLISGDSVGDNLVRAIRQIYQIKKRLAEIVEEMQTAKLSETYILREKAEAEKQAGRDMLAQMAARTKVHIQKSQRRLENLRNLNVAQEEYVKEQFGLDIGEFREK